LELPRLRRRVAQAVKAVARFPADGRNAVKTLGTDPDCPGILAVSGKNRISRVPFSRCTARGRIDDATLTDLNASLHIVGLTRGISR
jgi:hypothetical protein